MAQNPFRSIVYLTYDLQYHLALDPDRAKPRPGPFHLFNLALHFINGILLFLLIGRLARGSKLLPFAATAIFWVHPLCTESVNFISARFTLMASLFYLAAVYFYLDPQTRKLPSFLFWLCFLLGLACKETVATLPLSLALLNHVQKRPQRWIIPSFLLIALYIVLRLNWPIILSSHEDGRLGPMTYFLTQNIYLWLYGLKGFFPFHLNFDYHNHYSFPCLIPFFIINIGLVLLLLRAAYKRSFWAAIPLFFLILLLPTSSFIPLDDPFRESRAYLPTMVTSGVLARLFSSSENSRIRKKITYLIIFLSVLVILCGITRDRNRVWESPALLWRDAVTKSPLKHRPVYNYANALRRDLRLEAALLHYQRAHKLDPDHLNTIRNIDLVKKALASPELEKWKAHLRSKAP